MTPFIQHIARALFHAGGLGLLTLGMFDSSPLTFPIGNDLLVLALNASYPHRMPYYTVMATIGSLIGCLVTDWLSRKAESRLEKRVSSKYLNYIRQQVQKRAAWTLFFASLLPPPLPFTPFVATAAAFGYPRKKLFTFLAIGRLTRFTIEGALAIHYGRWIVRQARSPVLDQVAIAILVIAIVGSAITIYQWIERNNRTARQTA